MRDLTSCRDVRDLGGEQSRFGLDAMRVSSKQNGGVPKYRALNDELSLSQGQTAREGWGGGLGIRLSRSWMVSEMRLPGVGAIEKGATKMVVNSKLPTFDAFPAW